MANIRIKCGNIEMTANGGAEFIAQERSAFVDYLSQKTGGLKQIAKKAAAIKNETVKVAELPSPAPGIRDEVVAIYDNAGIPSFMHRFTRVTNKDLFDGGNKLHSAFTIGGEDYDEIFVSVYPNCEINGKPYSLPYMKPWTNLTIEDAEKACFSKGEGWHLLTAAEWGLLANLSLENGTLPHGNTDAGKYHADHTEKGQLVPGSSCITLTGSGPATWTHDHTPTGVHDLCGNIWEFVRGLRFKDGKIEIAYDNDAALPIDLSENGDGWHPLLEPEDGSPIYVDAHSGIHFTKDGDLSGNWDGCRWESVRSDFGFTETMRELALYPGEPNAYCYIDGSEGEYLAFRGGRWSNGSNAGVFYLYGDAARSNTGDFIGFRSAYFKRKTEN